ncbi:Crp/Fnr family transcriptional regulator [Exiguobacterium sp. s129]|uniref:Crp/Fnr family transcriptional regulator n=1 Tax=Exiguobacterium sp. s129 TaxID=2751264 RepID=UPI001BE87F59|nr:Crp/Fnr family transcriptional regulator [Exiguobacterium sp. s129]
MRHMWTIDDLRQLTLFETCPSRALEQLILHVYCRTYRKGQLLFLEGDPRERVYFLMSGYIKLERMNENATHHYADYVKPNQFFPYNGLFTGEDYRHTAEAVTDIEVIYIPTDRFERFVSTQSSMLLYIIGQMNRILDLHERRVQEIITPSAKERVINTLHFLIEDLGEPDEQGVRVRCPFTAIELSRLSGTSRETVSTILAKLRKEEILRIDAHQLVIGHPEYFEQDID